MCDTPVQMGITQIMQFYSPFLTILDHTFVKWIRTNKLVVFWLFKIDCHIVYDMPCKEYDNTL